MSTIKVSITGSNVVRDNHWEIPSGSITPVRTLLIEAGPRKNRATTESINLSGWTLTNVTRTASFTSAPDGTTTATFIKENTVNSFHYFDIPAAVGTNTLTGNSIFLKPAGRTRFYVGLNDTSGAYALADITLTGTGSVNGTVVNGTAAIPTIRIVPYSGSWYRVDIVARAASFGNPPFQIQMLSGSTNSYTGNGTSGVYVWGYNDGAWNNVGEIRGTAPTMFVRGVGTQTGSRDRDVIYWTVPSPRPMTIYIRGVVQGNISTGAERKIIQLGNYGAAQTYAGIANEGVVTDTTVRTQFIANYRAVTSSVTPSTGIRLGDPIELSMRIYPTGSGAGVQLSYALNGGTVQLGNSSSIDGTGFPATWYQINSMSLCTSDTFIQYAQSFAYRNILIATGSKTLEQMRTLAGI